MASIEDLLPRVGDMIASKYRVERRLGVGGMGAVFEVTHAVTQKRFAVKWLLPTLASSQEAVTRFIREAQVAGRVQHPNVVEIYDVGEEGGSFYMVMELLQGETLSERMGRRGKLPAPEACALMLPVLRGVAAAHAAGVIHRDLKPENIFACRTPTGDQVLKVLDFGISKMEQVGDTSLTATRAGAVMGTPNYMAPEQVRALPVDARTDVYALGVILYEMLAGVVPFGALSYGDLVLQIMTETPTPLGMLAPETPDALVDIVSRAMARDPNARFASVDELTLALEPYGLGVELPPFAPGAPSTVVARQTPASAARSTSRPKTPLSTESSLERTGARVSAAKGSAPKGLIVGVVLAAAAVLVLGVAAVILLTSDRDTEVPAAAAHPAPAPVDVPPAQEGIPLDIGSDAPAVVAPSPPTEPPPVAAMPSAVDPALPSIPPADPVAADGPVPVPERETSTRPIDRPAARRSRDTTRSTRPVQSAATPGKNRRTPDLNLDDF